MINTASGPKGTRERGREGINGFEIIHLLTKTAGKKHAIRQFNTNYCFKFCLTLPQLIFLGQLNTLGFIKGFIYVLYHKLTYVHLELIGLLL